MPILMPKELGTGTYEISTSEQGQIGYALFMNTPSMRMEYLTLLNTIAFPIVISEDESLTFTCFGSNFSSPEEFYFWASGRLGDPDAQAIANEEIQVPWNPK